jgi:hypothetical protein
LNNPVHFLQEKVRYRTTKAQSFYRLVIHKQDGSVENTDIVRVDRGKQGMQFISI